MSSLKAIIFDWGGVFCTPGEPFSHPEFLRQVDRTIEEVGQETRDLLDAYYRGLITGDVFWNKTCARFSVCGLEAQELIQAHLSSSYVHQRNLEIPLRLKPFYSVVLLSNLVDEMTRHVVGMYDVERRFHQLFFSSQTKLLKPEREAYLMVLRTLNVTPKETVFIDDSKRNVDAARELGIHALHLRHVDQLELLLHENGIKVDNGEQREVPQDTGGSC